MAHMISGRNDQDKKNKNSTTQTKQKTKLILVTATMIYCNNKLVYLLYIIIINDNHNNSTYNSNLSSTSQMSKQKQLSELIGAAFGRRLGAFPKTRPPICVLAESMEKQRRTSWSSTLQLPVVFGSLLPINKPLERTCWRVLGCVHPLK